MLWELTLNNLTKQACLVQSFLYDLECQLFCIVPISCGFECYWNAPRQLHNHLRIDVMHVPLKISLFKRHLQRQRDTANSNVHGPITVIQNLDQGARCLWIPYLLWPKCYLQLLLTCADFACQFFHDIRICMLVPNKIKPSDLSVNSTLKSA